MADQFTAAEKMRKLAQVADTSVWETGNKFDEEVREALTQAATTLDRIEQMREWLEATANTCVARNGVGMLSEQACRTVDEFSRLFPKSRDAWDDLRDAGGLFPKGKE